VTPQNTGVAAEKQESSFIIGRNSVQDSLEFIIKLNILLPYDPENVLLGTYPNKLKTFIHTNTYMQMFIPVLSIITKIWKQP
jgi:hypothetical protein